MDSHTPVSQQAQRLHRETPVADLHIDMLLTNRLFGYDIMKRHRNRVPFSPLVNHADIPRLETAGVNIVGLGLVTSPFKPWEAKRFVQIEEQMAYLRRNCEAHPDRVRMIGTADDLEGILRDDVVGALPGIEGAHSLNGDLTRLDDYRAMGVGYFTMAHFTGNEACNCPMGKGNTNQPGLTDFGRQVVDRVHELGMILDLAHTERQAFLEACDRSERPVIVSHTGVSGVQPSWRNIDDHQLEAVAKTGGVVGIIVAPRYLGGHPFRPLSDYALHVEHVAKVVGIDHVGIGSDLDGWIETMPRGFSDVQDLLRITELLLSRGMAEADVKKVIGENVVRVVRANLS